MSDANARQKYKFMTIQFHPNLLNRFVAPGISDFNAAEIPDMRLAHPEAENWMGNHFINNVLRGSFVGEDRQFAVNLLFRAQVQFAQYHQARDATFEFLSKSSLHSPALDSYFRAVALWETCLLSCQVFVELLNKTGAPKVFEGLDGSAESRAYYMANAIKHAFGPFHSKSHDNETLPLWLSNTGLHTRKIALTYEEFAALTNDIAKLANEVQDPQSFIASSETARFAAMNSDVADVIQDMKTLDQWSEKQ